MIQVLIADDEKLARQRIRKLLEAAQEPLTIVEVSSGETAISALNVQAFDLLFLDIQLTDMTGFQVLENVSDDRIPVTVFVTAYDQYALKAFEVQALDYLLKPYSQSRFETVLDRALTHLRQKDNTGSTLRIQELLRQMKEITNTSPSPNYLDKIPIRLNNKYHFVNTTDIRYICAAAYYAEIFTQDGKSHLYRISLSEFINKLHPEEFIRISRSVIVCLDAIREVESEGGGDYVIVMKDGKSFSLGKSCKQSVLEKLEIR